MWAFIRYGSDILYPASLPRSQDSCAVLQVKGLGRLNEVKQSSDSAASSFNTLYFIQSSLEGRAGYTSRKRGNNRRIIEREEENEKSASGFKSLPLLFYRMCSFKYNSKCYFCCHYSKNALILLSLLCSQTEKTMQILCKWQEGGDMQTPPIMVRFLLRGPSANYCTTVPGHFILNEKMKCRTPGKSFIGPAHSGKVVFTVDLQNLPKNKWCDITRNVVDSSVQDILLKLFLFSPDFWESVCICRLCMHYS